MSISVKYGTQYLDSLCY